MKFGWLWNERLRYPAGEGGAGGTGEGGEGDKGGGEGAKKTFNINGKEVDPSVAAAALNLYNSLADPETGATIIRELALRTGILKDGEVPDKADKKKLEGRFTKMMKTKLGKDYDKFSDTMGPVFDEAMEELVTELKEEIGGKAEGGAWDSVVENFTESVTFTPELEAEMTRLIKRSGGRPAGLKGKAAKEYLQDMYELAAHKLKIDLNKLGNNDNKDSEAEDDDEPIFKKRRNRRSSRNEVPEFREVARPKNLTIDDIVEAAAKGIKFKN